MITHPDYIADFLAGRHVKGVIVYELLPPETADVQELVVDGGFEAWTSPTDATHWEEKGTGATFHQETTIVRSGSNSFKHSRTATGSSWLSPANGTDNRRIHGDSWYHFSAWMRSSTTMVEFPFHRWINETAGTLELRNDGSWDTFLESEQRTPAYDTHWHQWSVWTKTPSNFKLGDAWTWVISGHNHTETVDIYTDDVSIRGPYLRPALYYSDRAVTWNGNTYSARVLKTSKTRDAMKFTQPKFELTLGHADSALRSYLDADTFVGGTLIVRFIPLDSNLDPEPDPDKAVILWQGTMRRPKLGTDSQVVIPAVAKLNPRKAPIPSRHCSPWCPVRKFADGVDCLYSSTTTTTNVNTGTESTGPITVADGTNLTDGQYIRIGPNGKEVKIVSGGGTSSITVDTAINWFIGWAVAYTRCDREWQSCADRDQLKLYQGFRTSRLLSRQVAFDWKRFKTLNHPRYAWHRRRGLDPIDESSTIINNRPIMADTTRAIPILIGRRWISPIVIEEAQQIDGPGEEDLNIDIGILCEGEINDIKAAKLDNADFDLVVNGSGATHGYYWRSGEIGITGTESKLDYQSTPSTQKRDQNTDYMSAGGTTFSRTAYQQSLVSSDNDEEDTVESTLWDVEGALLQQYNADGTPNGSPVYMPNAIWASCWLCTEPRFGLDLTADDLDMAVNKEEAEHCEANLASNLALTETTNSGTGDEIQVKSTEGFFRGQGLDVGADIGLVVDKVVDEITLKLTTSITWASGETVQGYVDRWETHWYKDDAESDALSAFKDLLESCRGYITHDYGTGKIQFRSERDHVTDKLTNGSLDDWSGGVPTGWTLNIVSNTVTEETTIVHTAGGSSAKCTVQANETSWITQSFTDLERGKWYLITAWVYATNLSSFGFNDSVRFRVRNLTANESFNPTTGWQSGTGGWLYTGQPCQPDVWRKYMFAFYVSPDHDDGDTYQVEYHFNGDHTLETMYVYLDDCKVEGPLAGWFRDQETDWTKWDTLTGLGSFDAWSGGVPNGWSKVETGGTITEDNVTKKSGAASARFLSDGTGNPHYLDRAYIDVMSNRVYEVSFWHWTAPTNSVDKGASMPRIELNELTTGKYWHPQNGWQVAYASWNPGVVVDPESIDQSGRWNFYSFRFRVDPGHETWNGVRVRIHGSSYAGVVSENYDEIKIEGPVDRVPLVQPGMGIIRDSFKWLNDDDERRDTNEFLVKFSNEDLDGAADEGRAFDERQQKRDGVVKQASKTIDSIGHMDHASRMADFLLRKRIESGSGAKMSTAFTGVLAQPGDVIAVSHQHPGWSGELKRITLTEKNLSGRRAMTADFKMEDYLESIYTNVAKRSGEWNLSPTIGTLTVTLDDFEYNLLNLVSFSGFTVKWTWSDPLHSIAHYHVHVSTTQGFTPGPNTHVGSTFGKKFKFFPSVRFGRIDKTLYFRVVANLPHAPDVISAEVSTDMISDSGADPTAPEITQGFNTVFDGGFDHPSGALWDMATPTWSNLTRPSGHFTPAGDGTLYASATNAYDGSGTSTSAQGSPPILSERGIGLRFDGHPSATPDVSRLGVVVSATDAGNPGATYQNLYYSFDGVHDSGWILTTADAGLPDQTLFHFTLPQGVDRADIEVKCHCFRALIGPPITGFLYDVFWEESNGVFSAVDAILSRAFIKGDGVSAYGEVKRPWPGEFGGTIKLQAGQTYTSQIRMAVQGGGSVTNPCLVQLYHIDTGTYYTLIGGSSGISSSIVPVSGSTTWYAYAGRWTVPGGGLEGNFEIVVRTLNAVTLVVDQVQVEQGDQIHAWTQHPDETALSDPRGIIDHFVPSGPWPNDDLVRRANVLFGPDLIE